MTNWELNYDIILVFQTNHGSFKLLKGNTSCDLKILKFCDIFRYLVSSFLCLFGILLHMAHCWTDGRNFCFWMLLWWWRVKNSSVTANHCKEQQWLESKYGCFPFLHRQPTNHSAWAGVCTYGKTATHCHWPCTSLLPPVVHVEDGGTERVNAINMFWLHK